MIGVLISLLGAAASFWTLLVYDGAVWSFTLLTLFGILGWTSFIWCGVWGSSLPEERTGVGFIGVVTGSIGLGVGLIAVILYGAPPWSYVIVGVSFVVFAGSLVQWERTG
jgi:hypothetical protein